MCVCCCAVWRTGRRKESYNVGVPTSPPPTAWKGAYVVNRAGQRTVRPKRDVCGGRVVVTGFTGPLLGWEAGLRV